MRYYLNVFPQYDILDDKNTTIKADYTKSEMQIDLNSLEFYVLGATLYYFLIDFS
jgi:hypothetical protein